MKINKTFIYINYDISQGILRNKETFKLSNLTVYLEKLIDQRNTTKDSTGKHNQTQKKNMKK